jgi:hypothetical protein
MMPKPRWQELLQGAVTVAVAVCFIAVMVALTVAIVRWLV